jgi:hypothetical protein
MAYGRTVGGVYQGVYRHNGGRASVLQLDFLDEIERGEGAGQGE